MQKKLIELLLSVPSVEVIFGKREGKRYTTAWHIANHLIANGVTVQEWIPVTERLPEHDGRYLCNVKYFSFPGSFYQAILEYDKHGFQEGHIYTDDVTHWMPLPEPPKGE